MTSQIQRLGDGTIELLITIPWAEVAKTYEHVIEEMVQSAELPGFRKGKAPRAVVEEKLDKTKVYEEALKHIIPEAYGKAVEEQKIRPIIQPKIELKEATEGKDWIVRALTCEKPSVTLGEYKKAISDLIKIKEEFDAIVESMELTSNKEFMESYKKAKEQIKNREFEDWDAL